MSLLIGTPVILPPRHEVLESWGYRPHAVIINGAVADWSAIQRLERATPIADRAPLSVSWSDGNAGVAASWNQLFGLAQSFGLKYVAILSQGVVLEGGTERLAELVEEHADDRGLLTDFAWHCIVFSVALWEQVGPFDEAFLAYYEDSDYVRRLFLAGLHTPENPMPKVGRDLLAGTETVAAAIDLLPPDTYARSGALFEQKWGGTPFKETFLRPYDADSVDLQTTWSKAVTDQVAATNRGEHYAHEQETEPDVSVVQSSAGDGGPSVEGS